MKWIELRHRYDIALYPLLFALLILRNMLNGCIIPPMIFIQMEENLPTHLKHISIMINSNTSLFHCNYMSRLISLLILEDALIRGNMVLQVSWGKLTQPAACWVSRGLQVSTHASHYTKPPARHNAGPPRIRSWFLPSTTPTQYSSYVFFIPHVI